MDLEILQTAPHSQNNQVACFHSKVTESQLSTRTDFCYTNGYITKLKPKPLRQIGNELEYQEKGPMANSSVYLKKQQQDNNYRRAISYNYSPVDISQF